MARGQLNILTFFNSVLKVEGFPIKDKRISIINYPGVSRWIQPLPDIALHTLPLSQAPAPGMEMVTEPPRHHPWHPREDQEEDQGDKEDYKEQEASRMVTPSSEVILKSRRCHKRVALNVGGVRHEVTWRLLEQYPQSR